MLPVFARPLEIGARGRLKRKSSSPDDSGCQHRAEGGGRCRWRVCTAYLARKNNGKLLTTVFRGPHRTPGGRARNPREQPRIEGWRSTRTVSRVPPILRCAGESSARQSRQVRFCNALEDVLAVLPTRQAVLLHRSDITDRGALSETHSAIARTGRRSTLPSKSRGILRPKKWPSSSRTRQRAYRRKRANVHGVISSAATKDEIWSCK